MKNKIIFLIIILSIINIYQKIDYKTHLNRIDNIFYNGEVNRYKYIGYIKIDSLNIKREILNYTEKNMVDSVVLYDGDSLDSEHIVLAGHAIDNIFGNLKRIKLNDIVEIVSLKKSYKYIVVEKCVVESDNYQSINSGDLVLITCKNFKERYIIKAKKIGT